MSQAKTFTVVPDIPEDVLEKYLAEDVLAIDTELHGLTLHRDQVCLVQISDRNGLVTLVRPEPPKAPPNLKKLLTAKTVLKIFHYAVSDVAFLEASLGIQVAPFQCTKVMSKLARTYTSTHSLKTLVEELIGITLDKESQSTNWAAPELTPEQLAYAANDVLYLVQVYEKLTTMLERRGKMPSGISASDLNKQAQDFLPSLVQLILNGYGDRDSGWEISLFAH